MDPTLDEIRRDGETTKLEPKLMRLLMCLAAHPGEVVSVEQLLDEVWKDVVVTPDSVYHAVAALRRALGDDSKDPAYIANVMRRGYRLIAPVARLEPAQAMPQSSPPPPVVATGASRSGRKISARLLALVALAALGGALVWLLAGRLRIAPHAAAGQPDSAHEAAPQTFSPPPHSIAVLPFVNLSGDKDQEYFSDGMTEELLNSLARIDELQVAARASVFSFKGKDADASTIARKLNVGAILEGSVRRSGRTIRVTAQLDDAVTGFHLWSQTYDRDLGDVLKIQTDIATAVVEALKVALLANVTQRFELGEAHNAAALDAYLRGRKIWAARRGQKDLDAAAAAFTEAIRLDDHYALAYAWRSWAWQSSTQFEGITENEQARAEADARTAVSLAPDLAVAHAALSDVYGNYLRFGRMGEEIDRAFELSPGNGDVLQDYAAYWALMGHFDRAIPAARRAVLLDPLNRDSHTTLAFVLLAARRYQGATEALRAAATIDPDFFDTFSWQASYMLGRLEDTRTWCEKGVPYWPAEVCLAVVYDKLGRHADAETQLAKLKASNPKHDDWYQYAQIRAQWGQLPEALDLLERAVRTPLNVGLAVLKVDPLLDPLRQEPRFQAIQKELKFPD